MVIACLLLGISGGIRFWREHQFANLAADSAIAPFPLNDLPRALGDWRSRVEDDDQLDPWVIQLAGASDYTIRKYLNEQSGDEMTALLIFGLAEKVYSHKPEKCYPAAGYELVEKPVDRELKVPGLKDPVRYRLAVYMKRVGGVGNYQEVYHTFYQNGQWIPDATSRWKSFRYHPGMFKIQLARPISGWSKEVHGPSEAILGALAQEIQSRVPPKADVEAGKTTTSVATEPAATHSTAPRRDGAG